MKSAKLILETYGYFTGNDSILIQAMKEYAEQAIERCAKVAKTKSESYPIEDVDGSMYYEEVVDEDSILSVKDILI